MDTLSFPGLGWEFPLDRVAISIGSFHIYWYGIILALGFALGLAVYLRNNRRCGIHPDEGLDVILVAMVGAIIGARAYYVIFAWDHYKDDLWEIFNLRGGGLAIYGGVIGGILAAWLISRRKKLPLLAVTDAAFPGVLLGQAIGRWGNFFNMEAFGCNTDLPWGMTSATIRSYLANHQAELFQKGVVVDPTVPVHPTFFYESVWNLIGVVLLMFLLMPRRRYDGQILLGYAAWYGLGRFFIEGLRTDSLMWGNVRVSQALGGALFLIGTALLIFFHIRAKKPMTLELRPNDKRPRIRLTRYADTEESHSRMIAMDAKQAKKKKNTSPTTITEEESTDERHED